MDEQKRPRAWVYARIPGDYDGTMNSYKVCSMQALHDGCDIVGGSIDERGGWLLRPGYRDMMRDDECLLLMRSEDPVIDKKYNLLHHPNVKYTLDAGGEPYVMPPDYMGDAVTITMDAVAAATAPEITEEMYEQLDYLEKHPEENYYENEENFSQYDQGD